MIIDVTCGLWLTRRGLIASVIDGAEKCHLPRLVPADESERMDWLSEIQRQHGPRLDLVLTDAVAALDPIGRLAITNGIPVWLAPEALVAAICQAAMPRPRHANAASLLARLPRCRVWRPHLRRVASLADTRQLLLF